MQKGGGGVGEVEGRGGGFANPKTFCRSEGLVQEANLLAMAGMCLVGVGPATSW